MRNRRTAAMLYLSLRAITWMSTLFAFWIKRGRSQVIATDPGIGYRWLLRPTEDQELQKSE